VFALLGFCLAFAGQALAGGNAGFAPPDSATSSGSEINEIYWIVIGIAAAIFLVVEGALVWFIFRFRRRPTADPDVEGPQIHGNTRIEIIWTTIPLLILIAIIVVTILKVPSVQASPAAGSNPLVVKVDAHQFYWEYTYPNGVVAVDALRLPTERPIRLQIDSYDVAHSWWVPELTGKKDAIPGRTNYLDFTIRRPGTFVGQCAELCGVQHAVMRTEVTAMPQGDFDAWLASERAAQTEGSSDLGEQTWEGVCAKCHGLDGKGDYGPSIAGTSTLSDRNVLEPIVTNGQDNPGIAGYMPPVAAGWPKKQLDALIEYLVQSGLAPAPVQQQGG
jgi:cytochrome c oxidase subunit 2